MDESGTEQTLHPLRQTTRPNFDKGSTRFRLVDLFSGCGGLTLGIGQALHTHDAALEIALAVDFEQLATEVYKANFGNADRTETASVEAFFEGDLGTPLTLTERRLKGELGDVDALVGGPPCQGHSNLNNHTRRVDSKNALYLRMVRAAEVLGPDVIVIENVPAVLSDRHDGEGVVARAERYLKDLQYQVEHQVVGVDTLGVAQTRKRHILLATKRGEIVPADVFRKLAASPVQHDLRWAIEDLVGVKSASLLDRAPVAKADNQKRMQWFLEHPDEYDLPNEFRPKCHQGEHSYKSMYGRLKWTEPAQTITSGFGSIGQGRYMHPDLPRALTAHEAARIQGFPDYFDFSACPTRTALATMIGNAVPPQLGSAIFDEILKFRMNAGQEADALDSLGA